MHSNKILLEFGTPEHGWLPVTFSSGEFLLEVDASDVPCNPIDQLCDALIQLLKGVNSPDDILWHLEPHCYFLRLNKLGSSFSLSIQESDTFTNTKKEVFHTQGSFQSIVLPLYRSTRKFSSMSYDTLHWSEINSQKINELKSLIKKRGPF